jgi:hypothetical protein
VLAVPYIFCGIVLSLAFTSFPERIGSLYASNMIGSGFGCLLVVPLIWYFGLPGSLLLCALLGALSAAFFLGSRKAILVTALSIIVTLLLYPFRDTLFKIEPAPSKTLALLLNNLEKTPEHTRWTPISRIDVVDPSPILPDRKVVLQDGDAISLLHKWGGDPGKLDYLDADLAAGPYRILEQPEVLIIGIGGGPDILIAYHNQATDVTAVEINPGSIEVLTELYKDYNGNIASIQPSYRVINSEGRAYVRRSDEKYDLIQIPGADSFTALQSGAYMVAESYLYTLNAMEDYLSHLNDGGMLGIVRISFDPPRENLKLVTSGATALRKLGITDPRDHIIVIRVNNFPYPTLSLFKLTPFTQEEVECYSQWIAENPTWSFMYAPGKNLETAYEQFLTAFAQGNEEQFYTDYFYNIRPATDDSPFFFMHDKLKNIFKTLPLTSDHQLPGESNLFPGFVSLFESEQFREKGLGVWMLIATVVQMVILTLIFIFTPLLVYKNKGITVPNAAPLLIYFSCLGLAYVSIEISFIQKFILFLSHPTYSTTVILFTFLVFSGLGSATTTRFMTSSRIRLAQICLTILFITGIITSLVAEPVINTFLPYSLAVRVLIAVLLLAPLSFCMGMPFPLGVSVAEQYSMRELIAWVWGVNAAFSVVGSILSIAFAMTIGFYNTLIVMLFIYLLAAGTLLLVRSKTDAEALPAQG